MFVDASAIVAILTREPEADALADTLERATAPITSAIAIFEATLALCRKRQANVATARSMIETFLDAAGISVVPITMADAAAALDAFSRYGKGRGHKAKLNLGECFAYAAARTSRSALLFKGDDFSHTDIRVAWRPSGGRSDR